MARSERWVNDDGLFSVVDVQEHPGVSGEGAETVVVSYELMASMLSQLGFERQD